MTGLKIQEKLLRVMNRRRFRTECQIRLINISCNDILMNLIDSCGIFFFPELRDKSWTIFLFSRKILSTSKWRIFRVSKGGAFSLLEKFSGRNWNFILTQKRV